MSENGTYVTPQVAHPYWAKHAYEVLVETAGRYDAVITYSELAEEVQRRSSLWSKSEMRTWIGGLLADMAKVNHARDEPPLTSLVVHKQDGRASSGYDEARRLAGQRPLDDPDERETQAANARLECYRHWGADVPADARPTVHTRTREARERSPRTSRSVPGATSRAANEERRGAVCPTCFMEMPLSGVCPNCQ
ncbi:hypothetical protein [Terrabacter terrigena]|uniref:Uncharacterized protein n=1 Tax=Terrabacter terrigena TaxID=574718 RepID=A0ABW3N4K9_9MICO